MGDKQLPELYPGWRTVRKIGAGSFGTVYEIERDLFGKIEKAALKCITIPHNDGDVEEMYSNGYDDASISAHFERYLANIVREYTLMVEMKGHANVVYCDDIRYTPRNDNVGWDITIRMELLTPLLKVLGPDFGEAQVIRLGKDLCRALTVCRERDIIHRDIKPQNIFVSRTGDYKLGDFGIAKTVEQTSGGTKIGTYNYMAPEVFHNKPYGSGADIYSLGLVMYWLLNERRMPFLPLPPKTPTYDETEMARHRRFMGEAIPAPKNGSDELKRIVLKACAFDPGKRFSSAREMLDALKQAESNRKETIPAHSSGEYSGSDMDKTMTQYDTAATVAARNGTERTWVAPVKETPPAKPGNASQTAGQPYRYSYVPGGKAEPGKTEEATVYAMKTHEKATFVRANSTPTGRERQQKKAEPVNHGTYGTQYRETATAHNVKSTPAAQKMPKQKTEPVNHGARGKKRRKWVGILAAALGVCFCCGLYATVHIWDAATCFAPDTCKICGSTQGEPLNHEWIATDEGSKCRFCDTIRIDCAEHQWFSDGGEDGFTCVLCSETARDVGTCGDDLIWFLLNDGTLTISGTGDMDDYQTVGNRAPWYLNHYFINHVVIESGVTGIGSYAFFSCGQITAVSIGDTVQRVNSSAFEDCELLEEIVFPESVEHIGFNVLYRTPKLKNVTVLNARCEIDDATSFLNQWTLGDPEQTVLYGYPGSTTEEVAMKLGYQFKAVD